MLLQYIKPKAKAQSLKPKTIYKLYSLEFKNDLVFRLWALSLYNESLNIYRKRNLLSAG